MARPLGSTLRPAHAAPPPLSAATVVVVRPRRWRWPGGAHAQAQLRWRVRAHTWAFPGWKLHRRRRWAGRDWCCRRWAAVREARGGGRARPRSGPARAVLPPNPRPAALAKRYVTWFFVAPWGGDEVVVDGHEMLGYRCARRGRPRRRVRWPRRRTSMYRSPRAPSPNRPPTRRRSTAVTRPSSDGALRHVVGRRRRLRGRRRSPAPATDAEGRRRPQLRTHVVAGTSAVGGRHRWAIAAEGRQPETAAWR